MKKISEGILLSEVKEKSILRLTLNDPDNKNSLSEEMLLKLSQNIKEASFKKSIKVIVIAAKGDVFCSGHNLKEITAARNHKDNGAEYFKDLFDKCSLLMQSIVNCSKPVIAEVCGIATAAGCQLVASCDLAISSKSSKFATPGVNLGLFCSTPMVALSRNVAKKDAMKMLLTGDMIDSHEAKRISLINDYVSSENLTSTVMELANKIAEKSSKTVKIGKEAFYNQVELSLSDAYKYTSNVMAENTMNDDAKEGISSFIDKRKPTWNDD